MSKHLAIADRGQVKFDHPARAREDLLGLQGKRITVTIERARSRRTRSQNSLLWARYERILEAVEELSGHTRQELHAAMKERFLPRRRLEMPHGGPLLAAGSTTQLTVEEFSTFLERVAALFAGYGVDVHESMEVA